MVIYITLEITEEMQSWLESRAKEYKVKPDEIIRWCILDIMERRKGVDE